MTKLKDQMTSNERMTAYFEGKEVDRLPAMPMIDSVGPRLIGQNYRFKNKLLHALCSSVAKIDTKDERRSSYGLATEAYGDILLTSYRLF